MIKTSTKLGVQEKVHSVGLGCPNAAPYEETGPGPVFKSSWHILPDKRVFCFCTWSLGRSHQRVDANSVIYERGLGPDYLHLTSGDWVTKASYLDAPCCVTDSQCKRHMPRPQGAFQVDSSLYVPSLSLLGELGAVCHISVGEDNWKPASRFLLDFQE